MRFARSTVAFLTVVMFAASALVLAACSDDDGASVRTLADCASAPAAGSGASGSAGSGSGAADDCPGGAGPASGSGVAPECTPVGDVETASTTVDVTLDEWTIVTSPASVPAGRIGFAVDNRGSEAHELVIVEGVAPEELPLDADGALDEEALPPGALIGEIEGFPAGDTCDGVFDLGPGSYTLVCNITETKPNGEKETHLREGMVTTFTVT